MVRGRLVGRGRAKARRGAVRELVCLWGPPSLLLLLSGRHLRQEIIPPREIGSDLVTIVGE